MAINWQEEQRRIKEEGKNRVNTTYDSAADVINKNRDSLIAQAGAQRDTTLATQKQEYQGLHDQAAAQEIVNRRRTGEAMANAGLTDSGLNRTQQTAITLARGNQDAALTRQQQDARDAINLAYDEMVLQAQNEAAQQLTANEKERNEYLAAVEEMYGENIAAGIAAEAEAQTAAAKAASDAALAQQQLVIDAYLDLLKAGYDESAATGIVNQLMGGGETVAATKSGTQATRTAENTPYNQRNWYRTKITGNSGLNTSFGLIDDNDMVTDEFGNALTMRQLYDNLINEGEMDAASAKKYILSLQNQNIGSYVNGVGYTTKTPNAQQLMNGVLIGNNRPSYVGTMLKNYVAMGKVDNADAIEDVMNYFFPTDVEGQKIALGSLGLSDEAINALITANAG